MSFHACLPSRYFGEMRFWTREKRQTCIEKRRWVGRVLEYFLGLDQNYVGCNPNWPRNWVKWPQKAVILGHV